MTTPRSPSEPRKSGGADELPDDPATRDERYARLAEFLAAWDAEDHSAEPDYDAAQVARLRLR